MDIAQLSLVPWWLAALVFGLTFAAFILVNQHFKLPPSTLMMWRGIGGFVLLLPLALMVEWPRDPVFYAAVFGAAAAISVSDRFMFSAAARYGAGVTSRTTPLTIWTVFSLWLVTAPSYREALLSSPQKLTITLVCLAGCAGAMMFVRRDPVGRSALMHLLPVFVLGAVIDVLNKTAMTHAPLTSALILYPWLVSTVVGVVTYGISIAQGQPLRLADLTHRKALMGGASLVIIMLIMLLAKNTAMAGTPNPAYVTTLGFSAPLWVLVYNRVRGITDQANIWAGMVFAVSAAALVLINA